MRGSITGPITGPFDCAPRSIHIACGAWPLMLALAGLTGCDLPTSPPEPPGALRFDAPAIYSDWAQEVGTAAHLTVSIVRVRWFVVPGDHWLTDDGRTKAVGQWFSDGRIYVAAGWAQDEGVVKHEILHELLRGDTRHKHPLFAILGKGSR